MLVELIQQLEILPDFKRFYAIYNWLTERGIKTEIHRYNGGRNLIVPAARNPRIGIASHYDTVPASPGANDNLSAVVVCLALANRLLQKPTRKIGVDFYFFDEEERGLLGSHAFLEETSKRGLIGLINMEMVGSGDQFALWPLKDSQDTRVLTAFERAAQCKGIAATRIDRIVMNTADHESFRKVGIEDSFTISCIQDRDLEVAEHYYKAMEFEVDQQTLYEIVSQAPIFAHYHKASDKSEHLSEETLNMTVETILEAVRELDR